MKIPDDCLMYTQIIMVFIVITFVVILYLLIDYKIKMAVKQPEKSHKITIRAIAAGSFAAWGVMQLEIAKTTLNTNWYGFSIELYAPINIIIFMTAVTTGVITGGTYFTSRWKQN